MAFPTIPTQAAGRLGFVNQLDSAATLTGPNLNTLTKAPGDLLIAIAGEYQSNAAADAAYTGWAGGGLTWTEIRDSTGTADNRLGVAYARVVTGSETGTVTVTRSGTLVGDASMVVLVIPGTHPTTAPEATTMAVATNAAADPAALSPSWGATDTLWIGVNGNGMTVITGTWTANNSAPTNYTDYFGTAPADTSTVGDFGLAVAFRQLNAASEDMGPFGQDTSNARSAALLIAVRPDPNVTVTAGSATVTFVAANVLVPPTVGGTPVAAAAEAFTGTNGDPWPSGRWNTWANGGTIDIQDNEGRQVPVGYVPGTGGTATTAALVDSEVLVQFRRTDTGSASNVKVWLRADSATAVPANGVFVEYDTGAATDEVYLFEYLAGVGTVKGTVATGLTPGSSYWLRLRAEGTTVSAKVWAVGTAEPGSFQSTYTTTLTGAGRVVLSSHGSTLAARWDQFSLGDLTAGTTAAAEAATVGFTAADAGAAAVVNADPATVNFGAADATVSTGVVTATVEVGAIRWLVAPGTTAPAGSAAAPFAAADASVALGVDAGTAAVPVTATDAVAQVTSVAEAATVPVAAADAAVAAAVDAGAASLPVAAADAVAAVVATAEAATVGFTAADATVSTATQTTAPAQAASVPVTGADAAVALGVDAGPASVPVAAADAVGGVGAQADAAAVPLAAADASVAVVVQAEAASVGFAAADATTSTLVQTTANADPATLPVTAADASVAVVAAAGAATVGFAAADATVPAAPVAGATTVDIAAADAGVAVVVQAGSAAVAFAAADATFARYTDVSAQPASIAVTAADATASVGAMAGAASVPVTAADASIYIPPPVPPPRWVEGVSVATGLVEGDSSGSGQVEGVLVGAGIVEGSSSL